MPSSKFDFAVTRQPPVLLTPAEPTPYEWKQLSDLDYQSQVQLFVPLIWLYPTSSSIASDRNPAEIIRDGLSKALTYYYPYAGRVRELPSKKLAVECTGEGVLFVEAYADVKLSELKADLHPPFPKMDELLHDVPGSGKLLNEPILLVQVTRLACGGFIVAARHNHLMSDGGGTFMLFSAAAELARGATKPSIIPVWERERLCVRNSLQETFVDVGDQNQDKPMDDLVHDTLFFRNGEIAALRAKMTSNLTKAVSTYDIIAAIVWKCRASAIQTPPEENSFLIMPLNLRSLLYPQISKGFYGNAVVFPVATTPGGQLCDKPLEHAVEVVRKTKADAIKEPMKLMMEPDQLTTANTYLLSDMRYFGAKDVDWGWGKPVYGGVNHIKSVKNSFLTTFTNNKGEEGVLVAISLPRPAMERLKIEVKMMLSGYIEEEKSMCRL